MTDIVERLNDYLTARKSMQGYGYIVDSIDAVRLTVTDLSKAADEITRLSARVAELKYVLNERDGGAHDRDCKALRHDPPLVLYCTCGHVEARAHLTAADGEG